MRRAVFLTVCLLFLSASSAGAGFYRWVDKDGKEFFTNEREQVPREYRSSAEEVRTDRSRVSVGGKAAAAGKPSSLQEHKDRNGNGEEYWRKRARKLRKELAGLEDKYEFLLKQEREDENKPKKLSASNSGKTKKAQSDRDKKKSGLEKDLFRKKQELEVDLPEEARKAEAYPGWLRE